MHQRVGEDRAPHHQHGHDPGHGGRAEPAEAPHVQQVPQVRQVVQVQDVPQVTAPRRVGPPAPGGTGPLPPGGAGPLPSGGAGPLPPGGAGQVQVLHDEAVHGGRRAERP